MPPEMGRLRNTVNGLDTYQIPKQVLECFLRKKRFFCTKTLLSDILAEPRTMAGSISWPGVLAGREY